MSKIGARLFVAILLLTFAASSTRAADVSSEPDAAQVDAIVRKLESSGALDAAVDRAIDRYVKRREQQREAEEAQKQAQLAKLARAIDVKKDHIRGSPKAEISLIEYTDFECPFCKSFHATPQAVLDRYGGRVNWVLRNFPLAFHDPAAHQEALAAECVARLRGNDAYWKFADAVFAHTKSNGGGLPSEYSLEKLAQAVGVQPAGLTKCMSDPDVAARVERDIADATAAGATGTPTTIVRNNVTGASEAMVGALPVDALTHRIDRLLGSEQPSTAK